MGGDNLGTILLVHYQAFARFTTLWAFLDFEIHVLVILKWCQLGLVSSFLVGQLMFKCEKLYNLA